MFEAVTEVSTAKQGCMTVTDPLPKPSARKLRHIDSALGMHWTYSRLRLRFRAAGLEFMDMTMSEGPYTVSSSFVDHPGLCPSC